MPRPQVAAIPLTLFFLAWAAVIGRGHVSYASEATVDSSSATPQFEPLADMELVNVPGGCFMMGDSFGDGEKNEKPVHEVCVDSFRMGKFTVTTGQFRKFVIATGYRTTAEDGGGCFATGSDGQWSWLFQNNWRNPGFTQSDDHPVVCVSWNDVVEFTKWLTEQSGRIYRLPTEAEWEYAARAGTTGRNYWGNEVDDACRYANVSDLTAQQAFAKKTVHNCNDGHLYTAPVGSFEPNDFSLYDMMGNVWQWTGDWYGKYYYAKSPKNNPRGPKTGRRRVPRGGSWRSKPDYVRASMRVHPPASQTAGVGFRVISPVQ